MLPIVAERLRGAFPDRPTGAYYAAAAEFMHDRLEPALSLVRDAIRLDGSYADAHNLQGAILARLGQAPAARKAFDAALRLNPRDGNAYRNFGLLELASGNKAAAAKLFAEALALDPASEVSRQGLEASRAY
jgi:Flp pilus assembly protein TadD